MNPLPPWEIKGWRPGRNQVRTNRMKTLLAAIISLIIAASVSRADETAIYSGTQLVKVLGEGVSIRSGATQYVVVDFTNSEVEFVDYHNSKQDGKKYTTESPVSVHIAELQVSSKQTVKLIYWSASGEYFVADFSGAESNQNLGGQFTTEPAAKVLNFHVKSIGLNGNSIVERIATGSLNLNLSLTRTANASDDSLSAAVTVVTEALIAKGYSATAP